MLARLGDVGLDQRAPQPAASRVLVDCERTHLGHIAPGEMQSGTAEHTVAFGRHVKVPDVLVDAQQGSRQHLLLFCVFVNERVNLYRVFRPGFAYFHCHWADNGYKTRCYSVVFSYPFDCAASSIMTSSRLASISLISGLRMM